MLKLWRPGLCNYSILQIQHCWDDHPETLFPVQLPNSILYKCDLKNTHKRTNKKLIRLHSPVQYRDNYASPPISVGDPFQTPLADTETADMGIQYSHTHCSVPPPHANYFLSSSLRSHCFTDDTRGTQHSAGSLHTRGRRLSKHS